MPHVILSGSADFDRFSAAFAAVQRNENGWILKLRGCYVASDKRGMLLDCTAVRSGFSQDFYLRTEQKASSVTVRVDPYMRIERNEGVQRCVLLVASLLLENQPDLLKLEKSNLPPEILASLSDGMPA